MTRSSPTFARSRRQVKEALSNGKRVLGGACRQARSASATASNLRQMERDIRGASDASRVRDGYLSALGYSVFAFVDGFEPRAAALRVEGPAGWPVFSTLAPRVPAATTSVEARAADYYALADAQIVMGPRASIRRLTDSPVPLYQAAYAESAVDLNRYGRLAVTAFQRVVDYFGSVPFQHYTVQQELLMPISPQHEYGMSMEHLDSSTYYLSAAGRAHGRLAAGRRSSRCSTTSPITSAIRGCRSGPTGLGTFRFNGRSRQCSTRSGLPRALANTRRSWRSRPGCRTRRRIRENILATRFRRNINGPAIPEAAAAGRSEPRRLDAIRRRLSHRPTRLLARRVDGRRHRRAHSERHEGREEPA